MAIRKAPFLTLIPCWALPRAFGCTPEELVAASTVSKAGRELPPAFGTLQQEQKSDRIGTLHLIVLWPIRSTLVFAKQSWLDL
ncbi:hypothetical protein CcaCcLH18_12003 [Colletotrichum camelliae]|nr:hypothetical protein CcaCcLH18_12003 [Colletotrichum camelliae]